MYRGKREGIDESIELDIWREHFMRLLEGTKRETEKEVREGNDRAEGEGEPEWERVGELELKLLIKKLKRNRAAGEDGIGNEAWRYMTEETKKTLMRLIDKIGAGGGLPGDWRKGIIKPIFKREEPGEVGNYRGVTLMDTAYKIYAGVLNGRLVRELEGKLNEGQMGFRKGRGTIDAMYVLNYLVNRELSTDRGKVFALFVDLRAAFDRVNREKLRMEMERMNIEKNLRERVSEIYRVSQNKSGAFKTWVGEQ